MCHEHASWAMSAGKCPSPPSRSPRVRPNSLHPGAGIQEGLRLLREGGTPARLLVIDDGWQQIGGWAGGRAGGWVGG